MGGWGPFEGGGNARSVICLSILSHACAKGKGEVGKRESWGIF